MNGPTPGKMKLDQRFKASILGWLNFQLALERQKRYFKGSYSLAGTPRIP